MSFYQVLTIGRCCYKQSCMYLLVHKARAPEYSMGGWSHKLDPKVRKCSAPCGVTVFWSRGACSHIQTAHELTHLPHPGTIRLLNVTNLTNIKRYLTVVLIHISNISSHLQTLWNYFHFCEMPFQVFYFSIFKIGILYIFCLKILCQLIAL